MALSTKQTEGLRLLLAGRTGGQVAKALDLRPETISRWRKLPAFRDALAAKADPSLTDHGTNVAVLKWQAFDVLRALLDSDDEATQLRAAAEVYRVWGSNLPPYDGPDEQPPGDDETGV